MRTFQLKAPDIVKVVGLTENGDYVTVDSADEHGKFTVEIIAKVAFEEKYNEVYNVPQS